VRQPLATWKLRPQSQPRQGRKEICRDCRPSETYNERGNAIYNPGLAPPGYIMSSLWDYSVPIPAGQVAKHTP